MSAEQLGGYELHEAAGLLPSLSEADLTALAEDIRRHGQQQPIVLFEGKILDGRHRLRACLMAGVAPRLVEWQGKDPVRWVLSSNFHRRQLTDGQKAIVAARAEALLEAEAGARLAAEATEAASRAGTELREDRPAPELPRAERRRVRQDTADLVRVSTRAVARGRALLEAAVPELVSAVEHGQVPFVAAEEVARLDEPEQRALVTQGHEVLVATAKRMREASRPVRPTVARAMTLVEERFAHFRLELVEGRYVFEGQPGDGGTLVTASAPSLRDALAEALAFTGGRQD